MSTKLIMKKRSDSAPKTLAKKVKEEGSTCKCQSCKQHNFHHGPNCCFLAGESFLVSQKEQLCKPVLCSFSCQIHAHQLWGREIPLKTLVEHLTPTFDKDHLYTIKLIKEVAVNVSRPEIDGLYAPNWAAANISPQLRNLAVSHLIQEGFHYDIADPKIMQVIVNRARDGIFDMWYTIKICGDTNFAIAFANEFVKQGTNGKLDLGLCSRVVSRDTIKQEVKQEKQ